MKIKQVTKDDLDVIMQLNEMQDFKLRDLNNCIGDKIVYDGNIPIAYGTLKRMAEAIILVNPKASKLVRARAMRELMKYAEAVAYQEKCQQLHCFVKNTELVRTLKKHFNFIETKDFVLVKEL